MNKIIAFVTTISLVALGVVLTKTNPSTTNPLGILFVFLLIYTSSLGVLTYILFGLSRLLAVMSGSKLHRRFGTVSVRDAYIFGSVLALGPVIFVAMHSIAAVGFVDLMLIALFEALACFYVWRRL